MISAIQIDQILWDVIEQHFDEAEFLLCQWERAQRSPNYNLADLLVKIESRIEAHTDGLLLGGPSVAHRVLCPQLGNLDEPIRAQVAALALLSSGTGETARDLLNTTVQAKGLLQTALSFALIVSNVACLDSILLEHIKSPQSESSMAILLEILTARGVDPGYQLYSCLESDDSRLIAAAISAAGRFGYREAINLAEKPLDSENADLRRAAMRTSLMFGSREAWDRCLKVASQSVSPPADILVLIATLGRAEDHRSLYGQLAEGRGQVEQILWALGYCGTIESGDACVPFLESQEERTAKAAAEALAWIGGFDLRSHEFQSPQPEVAEDISLPPIDRDNLDADLLQDGLDDLPLPNPKNIGYWWSHFREQLSPRGRYILGKPFSPEAVVYALNAAPLWRRHSVALELSIRTGGTCHVSTGNAFSSRQRRQISALARMDFAWVS